MLDTYAVHHSWSSQQNAALKAVSNWYRNRSGEAKVFYLAGFAGTGKTTLAKHFGENADGTVLFAAFTGKAASVMRDKGCEGATTIHSLIYRYHEVWRCPDHPAGRYEAKKCECGRTLVKTPEFVLNNESALGDADLLVLDECSMVNERIGLDLLSFRTPILVLGDPAQLPPPDGCGFFTGMEPNMMLTEVHRQARDNPIIRMSMAVREGRGLSPGVYGSSNSKVRPQICVGRNKTRQLLNARVRNQLGFHDPLPVVSDKIICLRNNYSNGLLNGTLWTVQARHDDSDGVLFFRIDPEEGGETREVMTHVSFFLEGREPPTNRRRFDEFDYGYALTVHKAQGSAWNEVVLINESECFREHRARWLYTGVTRAAKQLMVR